MVTRERCPDLPPRAWAALDEVARRLRSALGERVREVRLFGSAARGEYGPDSDLDVLVIVDALTPTDFAVATRAGSEVMLETGLCISVLPMGPDHLELLRRTEQRLARDLDAEGVAL
ncbi:MAG: nucleotidyltransferase domain-containing protein [Deltaproteobacteria bacterium]|nr:nucleotidyltransferase domain-containing protein [Deltaproteobacteria bacterium]